jgi:hypothetical protein
MFVAALPASGGGTVGVTGSYVLSAAAFSTYCDFCDDVPFCTEFIATGNVTTITPLPAALPLFATGLGAVGMLGWRRKRKNTAA